MLSYTIPEICQDQLLLLVGGQKTDQVHDGFSASCFLSLLKNLMQSSAHHIPRCINSQLGKDGFRVDPYPHHVIMEIVQLD